MLDCLEHQVVSPLQQRRCIEPEAGESLALDDPLRIRRTGHVGGRGPLEPVETMVQSLPHNVLLDLVGMVSVLFLEQIVIDGRRSDFEHQFRRACQFLAFIDKCSASPFGKNNKANVRLDLRVPYTLHRPVDMRLSAGGMGGIDSNPS